MKLEWFVPFATASLYGAGIWLIGLGGLWVVDKCISITLDRIWRVGEVVIGGGLLLGGLALFGGK